MRLFYQILPQAILPQAFSEALKGGSKTLCKSRSKIFMVNHILWYRKTLRNRKNEKRRETDISPSLTFFLKIRKIF